MGLFNDKKAQDMASGAKLIAWFSGAVATLALGTSAVNCFTKATNQKVKAVAAETDNLSGKVSELIDNNNKVTAAVEKLQTDTKNLDAKVTTLETDVLKLKTEVSPDQMAAIVAGLKSIKVKP